jgi:radical SAM protein with 4Fe4S-binding SPASM domain
MRGVVAQFAELLDSLPRPGTHTRPCGQVNVTGGEPLKHERLYDILEEIKAAGMRFALLTNGTMVDRECAEALASLSPEYVQISLDGVRGTHDALRGEGSFDASAEGLGMLRQAGVRTLISFTAHAGNFKEFPSVVKAGARMGATKVWTDRLIPIGNGEGMRELLLSKDQTREYVALVNDAKKRRQRSPLGSTEVGADRALQFLGGGTPYRCHAGGSLITVLPDGCVVPCRRMPIRVGSIRERKLQEIYFRSETLKYLREGRLKGECALCAFARQCQGGLRCLAYAVGGDALSGDPGCWLRSPAERRQ